MADYDTDSFGDILHTFRKRARLTQQQLAEKIGMHRHAVSRWEQGEVLPASKALVLEIARCLHLNDAEMRLFLEASLTAPAPLWAVPFPRNLLFVGRVEILEMLHMSLRIEPGGTSPQAVALHGLAGVGKTQTVLEYAYRHALDYAATFWINAETEESILESFATLARLLKLPAQLIHKQEDVVALVLNWFSAHRDWLLVFDNVEERELVARFVPASRNGSLLFTTRFPTLGTLAALLELQSLSTEESVRLLLRRAENHLPSLSSEFIDVEEERAARTIATALDGLPLALDQASAYIEESHCRFSDFLALFQHDALQVLKERATSVPYARSVEKTFTLAFERLQQQNPVAADLLTACCFLAPDEIPEKLLREGAAHLPEKLQVVLSDSFRFNAVLRDVLAHALLHRNARTATLTIHRLVQVIFKEKTTLAVQHTWIERLVPLLDQSFLIKSGPGFYDAERWAWCERVLPHALSVLQIAEHFQFASRELGSLLQKIGSYLVQRDRYDQAEAFCLRSLAVQKQLIEESHPERAMTLAELARVRQHQGEYQEAESLYGQAIALLEGVSGKENQLRLALSLHGLALFYTAMNRFQEAEVLFQRVLLIFAQQGDPDRHLLATALNDLAACYYNQGHYTQAEPLLLQALDLCEHLLSPHHADIGALLHNLGTFYVHLQRYPEAERFYQRSLAVYEQALGPEHMETAITLNGLAYLYQKQARYEVAEPIYHRALTMTTQVSGPDDPFVARILNNLAMLCYHQNRSEEAETAATRALAIYEQRLPTTHSRRADPLYTLALLAYQRCQYAQAEIFSTRALVLLEASLSDHPKLAAVLHLRVQLCRAQGKDKEAYLLSQRITAINDQQSGAAQPETPQSLDDYHSFSEHHE